MKEERMSPDQITLVASLITLFEAMAKWPVMVGFLLLIVGPWVLALMLAYTSKKRFEAVGRYRTEGQGTT